LGYLFQNKKKRSVVEGKINLNSFSLLSEV